MGERKLTSLMGRYIMQDEMKIKGPEGRPIEVDQVEVLEADERWNSYKLADGTTIRVKPVAVSIFRACDLYNEDDEPVYIVRSQNIIAADVPDKLKRFMQAVEEK